MIGMSTTNSEPFVIPFGGIGHALGTNPIALAAPTPDGIFDTDMATSQVAVNKIFNARDEGRTIPEGWGVDEQGQHHHRPGEVYAGGAARRLQGLRARAARRGPLRRAVGLRRRPRRRPPLRGRRAAGRRPLPPRASTPSRLAGREHSAELLGRLLGDLKAIPPAPGYDEVLVPGEPEARAKAERERDGIPLPPTLVATLEALSGELGVAVPPT